MDILSRNKGRRTQPRAMLYCLIKQTPHFRICEFSVIILCSLLLLLGFPTCAVCSTAMTTAALLVKQCFAQVRIFQVLFCVQLLSNAQPMHEYNGRVTKYWVLHSHHWCLNPRSSLRNSIAYFRKCPTFRSTFRSKAPSITQTQARAVAFGEAVTI